MKWTIPRASWIVSSSVRRDAHHRRASYGSHDERGHRALVTRAPDQAYAPGVVGRRHQDHAPEALPGREGEVAGELLHRVVHFLGERDDGGIGHAHVAKDPHGALLPRRLAADLSGDGDRIPAARDHDAWGVPEAVERGRLQLANRGSPVQDEDRIARLEGIGNDQGRPQRRDAEAHGDQGHGHERRHHHCPPPETSLVHWKNGARRAILPDVMASPGAIAFEIGPLVVRWYGILMAVAIVVGLWLGHREAKRERLPADDIISAAQWAILAGLVGARLYEVIFNWDYYGQYPAKIIAVWEGGLAIHGGLIVGPLVGALLAWRWRLPVLRGFDVAAPSIAIGQAIGRWGNFFNEEAFGRPTNLPWKLYISPAHRPPGFGQFEYFHPTFLYESLWDFAVFVLLVAWLRPRLREHPGALFFTYIGLYSIGRFAIEALRLDSFWVGQFRVPQLASLAGVIVALIGVGWTYRRTRPAHGASSA